MLCFDWLVFNSCDWCISNPRCSGVLFSQRSVSWLWESMLLNFNSTIPVDIVRVKSYVNRPFDLACVLINKLCLFPKWIVSSVVGMFWNAEVWVLASWMSQSCSFILSCLIETNHNSLLLITIFYVILYSCRKTSLGSVWTLSP